jgi:Flp pilus assembly protein TadD|tara:strand:+ start:238 stop:429 length:192 start_codon:yes stop_codon:yes gene_type:complete
MSIAKHDKTIADCTEAIRLNPNDVVAYDNRGVTYQMIGEKAKAAVDNAKAKELGYKPRALPNR